MELIAASDFAKAKIAAVQEYALLAGRSVTNLFRSPRYLSDMLMQADLIGTSLAIADLKAEVERVARSDAKVLITGESGVGKEIVARAIYAASPRANAVMWP